MLLHRCYNNSQQTWRMGFEAHPELFCLSSWGGNVLFVYNNLCHCLSRVVKKCEISLSYCFRQFQKNEQCNSWKRVPTKARYIEVSFFFGNPATVYINWAVKGRDSRLFLNPPPHIWIEFWKNIFVIMNWNIMLWHSHNAIKLAMANILTIVNRFVFHTWHRNILNPAIISQFFFYNEGRFSEKEEMQKKFWTIMKHA